MLEATYNGHFEGPKTTGGNGTVRLLEHMLKLLLDWKARIGFDGRRD